jgi:hypothetical protein
MPRGELVSLFQEGLDLEPQPIGARLAPSQASDDLADLVLESDPLEAGTAVLEVTLDLVTFADRKQLAV